MNPAFLINPAREAIEQALDSWQWLPIANRDPIIVTAFGGIFFEGSDGIWFLDTLEGTFRKLCDTRSDLEQLLATKEAEDHYFSAGFLERASREDIVLMEGECFNYIIHPVVGGKVEYSNVQAEDFVVAVHIGGQLHEQVRHLPPGTKITRFVLEE
jgi:hypothetical protein